MITDIRMKEVKSRAESVMEQQFTRLDKGSRISVTGSGGSKERSAIYVKKKKDSERHKGNCTQAMDGILAVAGASNGWISLCSFES